MNKLRVLFLGNSHTFFNDMPMIFKGLVEHSGDTEVDVHMEAYPGQTWDWHLKQGAQLRFDLIHGGYDYIVMQQAAHTPHIPPEDTLRDGEKLVKMARDNGVKPVILIPWTEKRYPDYQQVMFDTFNKLIKNTGAQASVAGYVWEKVRLERPDIELYWFDGEHASPYGSYVIACCAYAAILKKSPVGLPPASLRSMGGDSSGWATIADEMNEVLALTHDFDPQELQKPEKRQAQMRVMAKWGPLFPTIWDKKALPFTLDQEKCRVLQEWVWEAAQRYF